MGPMKTAVITGTSSGIGEVVSEQLLKGGWKVYGLSRSKPRALNSNFIWVKSDLSNPNTIDLSLQEIKEPTIDLFISNAGVAFEEAATAVTKESYQKMFSVNVLAPMLLVNALRDKIANATVISISSVSDRIVDRDFGLYCASKAANTRFFETLAIELPKARVYTLLPDYVDTPMLRELQAGRDFNWQAALKTDDMSKLTIDLALGKIPLESGSNIIVINNPLKQDLKSREKLYGYNTDSDELVKL